MKEEDPREAHCLPLRRESFALDVVPLLKFGNWPGNESACWARGQVARAVPLPTRPPLPAWGSPGARAGPFPSRAPPRAARAAARDRGRGSPVSRRPASRRPMSGGGG